MNKTYARIENDVAVEVLVPHNGFALTDLLHPDIAALFSEVPSGTLTGAVRKNGAWTNPVVVPVVKPVAVEPYAELSAMEFYLAFKPQERIKLKSSEDPIVQEFWATYEIAVKLDRKIDPNLVSVRDSIGYLATPAPAGPGILESADRIEQVLRGIAQ